MFEQITDRFTRKYDSVENDQYIVAIAKHPELVTTKWHLTLARRESRDVIIRDWSHSGVISESDVALKQKIDRWLGAEQLWCLTDTVWAKILVLAQ